MLGSTKTFSFSFLAIVTGLSSSSGEVVASISGTLCRSDAWEAKLDSDRAAVRDERTHCRYGLRDCDSLCQHTNTTFTLEDSHHNECRGDVQVCSCERGQ